MPKTTHTTYEKRNTLGCTYSSSISSQAVETNCSHSKLKLCRKQYLKPDSGMLISRVLLILQTHRDNRLTLLQAAATLIYVVQLLLCMLTSSAGLFHAQADKLSSSTLRTDDL